MQQKWFHLLYEQQYGQGITAHGPASGGAVGLTPAFLVGAMREPPGVVRDPVDSRDELDALLESMMDKVSGKLVCIAECHNIRQPRVSLVEGVALGHLGYAILRSDGSPSKLYASSQYFARASRYVDSLGDRLWNILGASISEGRFSYRGGAWKEFNQEDLGFIRRAFDNQENESQ